MVKVKKYPKIILVGRVNVGKSAIFNRLIGQEKSIVFDREGVTRDYLQDLMTWQGKTFELIDTGGFSLRKQKDPFAQAVRESVVTLLDEASLILFVCDGKNGLMDDDRQIATLVHRAKRPTILLLNKADKKQQFEEHQPEFYALGFSEILPISAAHGTGFLALLEKIISHVQAPTIVEAPPAYKVVLLGRPNVGKSSLMNLLLKAKRSIVSEVPGTTREAIRERLVFHQDTIELIDTAGIRRKKKVEDPLELLMVKRSLKAVRESHIVILMVDASDERLADQELKLLFYAFDHDQCVLLIFNKIDLIDAEARERFDEYLKQYAYILKKIPQVWISCSKKKNIGKVLAAIRDVWLRSRQIFDRQTVKEVVKGALLKKPMYSQNMLIRMYDIAQIASKVPTFVLKVNNPELLHDSHRGFIENILRKHFDLKGCPVNIRLKKV